MTACVTTIYRAELHCETDGCTATFTQPYLADELAGYYARFRQAATAAGWTRDPVILGDGQPASGHLDNHRDLCPACTAGHGPIHTPRYVALPPGEWYVVVELGDRTDLPHVVNGAEIIADHDDARTLSDDYNDRAATGARPGENIPQYVPMQLVEVQPR